MKEEKPKKCNLGALDLIELVNILKEEGLIKTILLNNFTKNHN